ncbi:MAG: HAD-IIIA family hydrolase [Acidimicrobiales bacterium]
MTARPGVFLDRDGVLNTPLASPHGHRPPWTVDELVIEDGAHAALQSLHEAGYVLIVVTNQPDIASGKMTASDADRINARVADLLPVDEIIVCPHSTDAQCECKKPAAGMLLDAALRWSIDLAASWMVGDRWVDIAAGAAAGVRTMLIERAWSWKPTSAGLPAPDLVPATIVSDIAAAASYILHADAPQSIGPRLP